MTIQKCKAVLFDMDGLLINTEDIYSKVTSDILAKYDRKYTWELKTKVMGLRQQDAAQLLVKELNIELGPDEYLKIRNEMHLKYFEFCEVLPGVERLVRHLKSHKIPIAVASSSEKSPFELKTKRHRDIFSLFDEVVLGDDPELKRGKPNEEIFVLASKRLGFSKGDSDSILVFEDSLAGIDAANRGNFEAIWIPHPEFPPSNHKFNCTTLASMSDFDPSAFGLPAYK